MSDDRLGRLTDRQKQCLRLVARGFEVKEIARDLDLSPSAVIERLRIARRVLEVDSSREAARLLAIDEASPANMWRVDTPAALADVPYPLPPIAGSGGGSGADGFRLQEVSAPFVVLDPYRATGARRRPLPWRDEEGRSNDLTIAERLLASGGLTIGIAIGAAIVLIAIVQLLSLLIALSRHGG